MNAPIITDQQAGLFEAYWIRQSEGKFEGVMIKEVCKNADNPDQFIVMWDAFEGLDEGSTWWTSYEDFLKIVEEMSK